MPRAFLLTLVLAVSGLAACSDRPAVEKEPPAGGPAASTPASSPLLALLPGRNEVPGWAFSREPRTFTPDNLWELINGAADGFVTYGVQEVVTADYTQAGTGYQAVIEIYQMKDPLNAFGKYAEERNPASRFLEIGNEGYSGGTAVNFWKGRHYVKITTFEQKDAIEQEMVKLARSVASKVPAAGGEPLELSYFPREHQLPHTTLYIPRDVLAQSYFANGFEARYKTGEKEHKLILVDLENEAAARDALTRYRQAVTKGGKDVRTLTAPGEGGFTGKDSFYGNLAAVRTGKYIAVALGAASEDAGRTQLGEIVRAAARPR